MSTFYFYCFCVFGCYFFQAKIPTAGGAGGSNCDNIRFMEEGCKGGYDLYFLSFHMLQIFYSQDLIPSRLYLAHLIPCLGKLLCTNIAAFNLVKKVFDPTSPIEHWFCNFFEAVPFRACLVSVGTIFVSLSFLYLSLSLSLSLFGLDRDNSWETWSLH